MTSFPVAIYFGLLPVILLLAYAAIRIAWNLFRYGTHHVINTPDKPPLINQNNSPETNWKGRYQNIPNKYFGHGCDNPFPYYLSGESQVKLDSIDEICNWLLGCRYVPDPVGQGKRDHWLHPSEFEKQRAGDCEDYALWTWRKLHELNIKSEFMVGKWLHDDGRIGTHAWVVVHDKHEPFILETTGSDRQRMIKPLANAIAEYIPFASVDGKLHKKVYMGILYWLRVLSSPNYVSRIRYKN